METVWKKRQNSESAAIIISGRVKKKGKAESFPYNMRVEKENLFASTSETRRLKSLPAKKI